MADSALPLPRAGCAARPAEHVLAFADARRHWIFLGLALIYLAGFNGQWHVEPDSAQCLTIARNLAQGQGYTYHGQVERTVYPGWPWLLAGTFKLFTPDTVWPALVLLLLLAAAALALTYRLFLLHAGRPVAVVVTALVGLSQLVCTYTFELRGDLPFLVGVLATLVGFEAVARALQPDAPDPDPALLRPRPHWLDWALLPVGLLVAAVMRPTMLPLLACVLVALVWALARARRRRAVSLIALAIVVVIGVTFLLLDPRRRASGLWGGYEDDVLTTLTTGAAQATVRNLVCDELPQLIKSVPVAAFGHELGPGVPDFLAAVAVLALGIALARRRALWGLWVAATVAVMLLTKVRDRYFLPLVPLLAYAWWAAAAHLSSRLPPAWAKVAFSVMLTLWVGINSVKIAGLILDQRRLPFLAQHKDGRYLGVRQLGAEVNRLVPDDGVVLGSAEFGRILTWYSHRDVLDPWERHIVDPHRRPLFLILPDRGKANSPPERNLDSALHWIEQERRCALAPGPLLAEVPDTDRRGRRNPKRPPEPWRLHSLTVTPAP